MAARRLILVMLVLLVLSSAVAALIPIERNAVEESSTSTTTTTTEAPPPTGELLHRRITADARKPEPIRIDRGDQLELTVTSSKPGQVEVLVLGSLEAVDRFDPAHYSLLPADPGSYEVRFIPPAPPGARGRVIARIVVGDKARSS